MVKRMNEGYRGKSTIDYLPLKNHVVLEGIRESSSGIIIPGTAMVDTEKYDHLKVVAIGPRAMDEGLEIGDFVTLDPRLTAFGITLPKELAGDRVFIEYEMTAVRGIIPKRAIKRLETENEKFRENFIEDSKSSKNTTSGKLKTTPGTTSN